MKRLFLIGAIAGMLFAPGVCRAETNAISAAEKADNLKLEKDQLTRRQADTLPLKNIKKVILFTGSSPFLDQAVYTVDSFRQAVVVKLKDMGITVIPASSATAADWRALPCVGVDITLLPNLSAADHTKTVDLYYKLDVTVIEHVILTHDRSITAFVKTYEQEKSEWLTPPDFMKIHESFDAIFDKFAADYAFAQKL
jgi:hypothetical protein